MARRTKEEAQETRNRILDFAEHVFGEKGVSRTSLADLAKAAGVTRGAIYWHFRNKSDLFEAMMARVTLPMEEMAQRAGDTNLKDPLGYVRSCALNVLERLASDPQCQRVFDIVCHKCEYVDEMAPQKARHLECRAECLNEIETGFVNAIRKGQLPPGVNARRAAISLHALIDGLIANWVLDPRYHPLAADAENIVDGFLGGLAALKTAPPAKAVKPVKSGKLAETAKPAPPAAKRTRKPEPAAA